MDKKLLEVHSKRIRFVVCDYCDNTTAEVYLYYRLAEPDGAGLTRRFLSCCRDKIGIVVDWTEEE